MDRKDAIQMSHDRTRSKSDSGVLSTATLTSMTTALIRFLRRLSFRSWQLNYRACVYVESTRKLGCVDMKSYKSLSPDMTVCLSVYYCMLSLVDQKWWIKTNITRHFFSRR